MSRGILYLLSAFTASPEGGNPAGVWIGEELPESSRMLQIAKEVGFSETAFLAPEEGFRRTVRYYSLEAEVPFCGHATIAAGVKLGEICGEGRYLFDSAAGEITVDVHTREGLPEASLTSVEPRHYPAPKELLRSAFEALRWTSSELDRGIPPAMAFAGAWHLVIASATFERLDRLDYDFAALKETMLGADITTVQLIWREKADVFHARNPFPVGGIVEDPATGAAAAALGGYLRDAKLIEFPARILIRQGEAMGRPSRISVYIPERGGIVVSGHAVNLKPELAT